MSVCIHLLRHKKVYSWTESLQRKMYLNFIRFDGHFFLKENLQIMNKLKSTWWLYFRWLISSGVYGLWFRLNIPPLTLTFMGRLLAILNHVMAKPQLYKLNREWKNGRNAVATHCWSYMSLWRGPGDSS